MATAKIGLKTLSVSLLAVLLIEALIRLIVLAYPAYPMAALGFARIVQAVAILNIVQHFNKGAWVPGPIASWFVAGCKAGLIWSSGFGLITVVIFAVLFAIDVNPLDFIRAPMPIGAVDIGLLFLVGGILSPVAEEIFFRGILYGYFRRWGVAAAVILSTLIFAIAHTGGSQIPVTQLIGGLVFAIAYEKEDNLMVPITIHILGNTAIFSIGYIAQYG